MSRELVAAGSLPRMSRSFPTCAALIPALEPVKKNFSRPLCLKFLITDQIVTYNVTGCKQQRLFPDCRSFLAPFVRLTNAITRSRREIDHATNTRLRDSGELLG